MPLITIVWVPGGSGCRSATKPCADGQTFRARWRAEDVVRRQDDLQRGCLHLRQRHGPAVEGDRRARPDRVGIAAHARSCSSVIRFPSHHLRGRCCTPLRTPRRIVWYLSLPCTKTRRRPQTAQPCGGRGRSKRGGPPVPKGFWELGVSSTVVHSAARLLANFFDAVADAGATWANTMPRIAARTIKARVTMRFIRPPNRMKEPPNSSAGLEAGTALPGASDRRLSQQGARSGTKFGESSTGSRHRLSDPPDYDIARARRSRICATAARAESRCCVRMPNTGPGLRPRRAVRVIRRRGTGSSAAGDRSTQVLRC